MSFVPLHSHFLVKKCLFWSLPPSLPEGLPDNFETLPAASKAIPEAFEALPLPNYNTHAHTLTSLAFSNFLFLFLCLFLSSSSAYSFSSSFLSKIIISALAAALPFTTEVVTEA